MNVCVIAWCLTVAADPHPLDPAIDLLRQCQEQYRHVRDYQAIVVKEERIGRSEPTTQTLEAKFRTAPFSVYYKWTAPDAGKEAIFVEGANDNKLVTHPAGLVKAFTGTLFLEPEGKLAMKGSRQSIRDAGIGPLIDKLLARFEYERRFQLTEVEITHVKINDRPCYRIKTVHPGPEETQFIHHTCKVYIDKQHLLPTRMEGYAFPATAGRQPGPLMECQTYVDLKVNVGLTDLDFSARNPAYDYARF